MNTQEIPREQWQQFFDRFNHEHEGWRAHVELMGREMGDQIIADDMPLQGIDCERKGSEKGDILIGMGERPDQFMTHAISHPSFIRFAEQPGREVDIEIGSADGPATLLRLKPAPMLH